MGKKSAEMEASNHQLFTSYLSTQKKLLSNLWNFPIFNGNCTTMVPGQTGFASQRTGALTEKH
ncbi:MAG TPA: hypothetical protein VE344_01735 [Methylomirabilota bacterium]|nr:hypothetical protein [Methylomirabilota bacterium]